MNCSFCLVFISSHAALLSLAAGFLVLLCTQRQQLSLFSLAFSLRPNSNSAALPTLLRPAAAQTARVPFSNRRKAPTASAVVGTTVASNTVSDVLKKDTRSTIAAAAPSATADTPLAAAAAVDGAATAAEGRLSFSDTGVASSSENTSPSTAAAAAGVGTSSEPPEAEDRFSTAAASLLKSSGRFVSRKDLIASVTAELQLPSSQVEKTVAALLRHISAHLEVGRKVALSKFGVFTLRRRSERAARNPRTGETVHVAAATFPVFAFSKSLKDRLRDVMPLEDENSTVSEGEVDSVDTRARPAQQQHHYTQQQRAAAGHTSPKKKGLFPWP